MKDSRYRIGIIRVVTQNQDQTDTHGRLLEAWFPQYTTISRCIPDQPDGIHDETSKALALPKIIARAHELVALGAEGIIISCADDPALEDVRRAISLPVVGAGESTAAAAARYGNRVFTLGITEQVPAAYPRVLGNKFAGNAVPEGISNTRDLRTEAGHKQVVATARSLRKRGADVIALACTGLASIGIAPLLERETGILVFDPMMCEGHALLLDLMRAEQRAVTATNEGVAEYLTATLSRSDKGDRYRSKNHQKPQKESADEHADLTDH